MKKFIAFALGCVAFFFCVIRPIEADLIASLAKRYPISQADKAMLLNQSLQTDSCNGNILNLLGDSYISDQSPTMAAMAYGRAMECSPGNSLARFKFGESLLMMGFIEGTASIDDAMTLEPHNPVYQSEKERITKLLLPSP